MCGCADNCPCFVAGYKAGNQAAALETYKPNLAATAAREAWMAANPGEDWHVRRYGE